MAKKPKPMLPESYRPFVPGHSEPKHGQEAKIMYLKCLLNRRHGTIVTYRDITQVLIYCR